MTALTEQALLEGAWWALEQAGRDMHSATLLYNAGDLSGAVVRGLLAREEIGRSRKLQAFAKRVTDGGTVTVKSVRGALNEHVRKQRFSVVSVTLKNDPAINAIFRRFTATGVGSSAWHSARAALDKVARAKQELLPTERHALRMRAQYVDIDDQGAWVLPRTLDRATALDALNEAIGDYAVIRNNLSPSNILHANPTMARALVAMTPKPVLPPPMWP